MTDMVRVLVVPYSEYMTADLLVVEELYATRWDLDNVIERMEIPRDVLRRYYDGFTAWEDLQVDISEKMQAHRAKKVLEEKPQAPA